MNVINLAQLDVGIFQSRLVGIREYLRTTRLYKEFAWYSGILLAVTVIVCGGILAAAFLR